jgi:hypothetical protein
VEQGLNHGENYFRGTVRLDEQVFPGAECFFLTSGRLLTEDLYPLAYSVILAGVEPYTLALFASIDLDAFDTLGDEVGPTPGTDKYFAQATALLSGNSTRCRQQSGIHGG